MILEILAKYHDKWLRMAEGMNVPDAIKEDIVQEMYLKISDMKNPDRLLYKKDEPNTWYVYLTLRSVFIDVVRGRRDLQFVDECESLTLESKGQPDYEYEEGWDKFYNMILASIRELGPYGAKLCESYFSSDLSIRQIAREANISPTSIFHSIKQYRAALQEQHWEDYQDFINEDWNKI